MTTFLDKEQFKIKVKEILNKASRTERYIEGDVTYIELYDANNYHIGCITKLTDTGENICIEDYATSDTYEPRQPNPFSLFDKKLSDYTKEIEEKKRELDDIYANYIIV